MPNPVKIIVLDDDEEICMMIKLVLEHHGFSVITLLRADKLLPVLEKEKVQLLILDMLIGSAKGTDVCRSLKNNAMTTTLPVIMITALPDAQKICREAGADDFIAKPFDMDNLILKIRLLLTPST